MPANRDASGKFVAGNNANPSGRPKVPQEVRVLIDLLHSKKEAYRLEAAKTLLDRGYGKPEGMSKIELVNGEHSAFVFKWLDDDEKTGNENSPK